jgi:hypothetical protein
MSSRNYKQYFKQLSKGLRTNENRHSTNENKILRICEKIESYLNNRQFLQAHRIKFLNQKAQNVIYMVFRLYDENTPKDRLEPGGELDNDTDTYCTAKIIATSEGKYDKMEIQYINSTLGHGVGMFLMYLFLLMAYLSNITDIVLDNYTDNPVLAAQRIYKLFKIDRRGHSPNAFKGLPYNQQLHVSAGAMRLVMYGNFLSNWVSDLVDLQGKTIGHQSPWTQDPPFLEKLTAFVAYLKQNYPLPSIQRTRKNQHSISNRSRTINKNKKNDRVLPRSNYGLHPGNNNEEETNEEANIQNGGSRKKRHTRKKRRTHTRKH